MKRYEWCPGNGTRYDLLYGKVGNTTFITYMRYGSGGLTCIVPDYLHYTYLMEKTQINIADAAAILQFLERQGHPVGYPISDSYENSVKPPKLKEI